MEHFDLVPMDEESKILIHHIEHTFEIERVEPVYFMSALAGHEIITYNVKKLYLAKNIVLSENIDAVNIPYLQFMDSLNALQLEVTNPSAYWDTVLNQAHYITNYITLKNILFSRLVSISYNRFYMIGYRITLQ